MIDVLGIAAAFAGLPLTIITTSDVFPIARGEVVAGQTSATLLAVKLLEPYDCFGPGAIVFFAASQIVAVG